MCSGVGVDDSLLRPRRGLAVGDAPDRCHQLPAWTPTSRCCTIFEAPTVAELAPRIGGDAAAGLEPLVAGARPDVIPLSFAQNRLWFFDQLQGPSPIYNLAVALRLRGRLDADALRSAMNDVVARHESLRTLFVAPDGTAQQVVIPVEDRRYRLETIDAAGWEPSSRIDAVRPRPPATPSTLLTTSRSTQTLSASPTPEHILVAARAPHRRRRLVGDPAGARSRPGLRRPVRGRSRRAGRRCRCSTRTTRSGSARSWATSTMTAASIALAAGLLAGGAGRHARATADPDGPAVPAGGRPSRGPGGRAVAGGTAACRSAVSRASTTPPASW